MPLRQLMLLAIFAAFVGCAKMETDESNGTQSENNPVATEPETVAGETTELTPQNTTIGFVGSHIVETPPDPEARSGTFKEFTGAAVVADGALQSLTVEIDVASLDTGNEKLDNHLKSADFFDVRENPRASFQSTNIAAGDGNLVIQGDLSLLKAVKPIEFEAEVSTEGGLELQAEFDIDRTEFGMNYGTDKLEKAVRLSVSVIAK